MAFALPPAVKLAETIARDVDRAVSRFRRDARYVFGEDLRKCAWLVLRTAYRAATRPDRRAALLSRLRDHVDDLRLCLQLGKELGLFSSFGQFEALYRQVAELGRQAGAWHRHLHPQGQSARLIAAGQRATTLSSHAASTCEAKS